MNSALWDPSVGPKASGRLITPSVGYVSQITLYVAGGLLTLFCASHNHTMEGAPIDARVLH